MLKILAMITMLIDHTGITFFPETIIFSIIGRLSFPLFAWTVAAGIRHTKNAKKYCYRVFYLALISQIPYFYLFHNLGLNVCFTLLVSILVITLYRSDFNIIYKWIFIVSLIFLTDILNLDYGIYGVATIVIFFILHNKLDKIIICQTIITILSLYVYNYDLIQLYSLGAILLIIILHKKDIKINTKLNYLFYPSHMIGLLLINMLL